MTVSDSIIGATTYCQPIKAAITFFEFGPDPNSAITITTLAVGVTKFINRTK